MNTKVAGIPWANEKAAREIERWINNHRTRRHVEDMDARLRCKRPVTITGRHPYTFRCGEAATIVGVHWDGTPSRICYKIVFPDGIEDSVPILEANKPDLWILT